MDVLVFLEVSMAVDIDKIVENVEKDEFKLAGYLPEAVADAIYKATDIDFDDVENLDYIVDMVRPRLRPETLAIFEED